MNEEFIDFIISSAKQTGRELTYQQAKSIALRSDEIYNDSGSRPKTDKYKTKEIEVCWQIRNRQLGRE